MNLYTWVLWCIAMHHVGSITGRFAARYGHNKKH